MAWVENKTEIGSDDILLFQDTSADVGSKTGFITVSEFLASLMPIGVGLGYQKEDKPSAATEMSTFFPVNVTVPADLAGAVYFANTGPTAEAVISVRKNGVEFATMTVAIGDTSTVTLSGTETAFTTTDRISFVFPTTQDDSWAGISILIKGIRS